MYECEPLNRSIFLYLYHLSFDDSFERAVPGMKISFMCLYVSHAYYINYFHLKLSLFFL